MTKRTVAEWITVAKISHDVGHIFFEGSTDARIIAHASGYPSGIDFRSADEIDEEEGQSRSSLLSGNKMRLVVLASRASIGKRDNIRCLIDSDFAIFVSHLYRSDCLFETEFANLPASTLTFKWLQGFMLKGYGITIDNNAWDFFCSVLKFAFVARFISSCSDKPRSAPSVSEFIVVKRDSVVFDNTGYIKAYFGLNPTEALDLKSKVDDTVEWLGGDIRRVVNSNDLFELIYIYLKRRGKISGSTSRDAIRQSYFSALDDAIFEQSGFDPLREWMKNYANE